MRRVLFRKVLIDLIHLSTKDGGCVPDGKLVTLFYFVVSTKY